MSKILFKEEQRFDNRLALFSLGLLGLGAIIGGITHLLTPIPNYPVITLLFITTLAIAVGIWWLTSLKMKVVISEKGIKFKLSPIHPKKHSISWKKIDSCTIVKTSEAAQWCGGNITFNHERRVSLTGRNGLAIKTKKGENLFIGIKQITGLYKALDGVTPELVQE